MNRIVKVRLVIEFNFLKQIDADCPLLATSLEHSVRYHAFYSMNVDTIYIT